MYTNKILAIILVLLFIVFYLFNNLPAYSSPYEALSHQKEVKKVIELVTLNKMPQYALVWDENNQVAAVSINKNLFGWNVGLITNSFKNQNVPINSGIVGYARHGNDLLYGIINDTRIDFLKIDDIEVRLIPLKEDYKLWYIKESKEGNNVYKSHSYKAYDKNKKLVHQITM